MRDKKKMYHRKRGKKKISAPHLIIVTEFETPINRHTHCPDLARLKTENASVPG
jgi:hypothetical protein